MTASTDVESQSGPARSRSRCLDTFLTVSVIALFVMFACALAGALWFAKHLENEINGRKPAALDGSTDSLIGDLPGPEKAYKVQNFAYLRASKSELKQGSVMEWESIPYGKGHTVGSLYEYHDKHRVLKVKNSGSYFLYVQLNISCGASTCPRGEFTVSFFNQDRSTELTCTVQLPDGNEPISRTCWRVITFMENDNRLIAKSYFKDTLGDWRLEMNDSGFGLFLVDGVQAAHHT